jgi:putative protease
VQSCDENGLATLSLRNKFAAGDQVEIVGPDTLPQAFAAPTMIGEEGNPLQEARKPQSIFRMQLPKQVPTLSVLRRQVDLSPK